jgi:hypothetical protein
MTITLDDARQLVDQLSPLDQLRLIEYLSRQIAPALAETSTAPAPVDAEDAWGKLARLREEFRELGPVSPSPAEQLDADRRERDAMLMGRTADDVHT